ncbi:MAG TPA: 5'/3'-nucleotidase SurE [Nannocystaceae bacterium]|nr:5'/3'-nucleotidase SurE [Nannocystaceae bacterium]
MHILVTNDDGIYSPGLAALAAAAERHGKVRVVAPDVEQSSMGHAITHSRPLTFRPTPSVPFDAHRVNGTPADCVALGCHMDREIELVLSGVNLGLNLGNSAWHSGTLAAAKQAALLGRRGIAFSTSTSDQQEPDFDALGPCIAHVLAFLLEHPQLELVNVNIPISPKGMRWTRQSVRHYDGRVVPTQDPRGRPVYWSTVAPVEPADEGTDRWAIENDLVSITPLRLDLTDHAKLAEVAQQHPLA